MLDLGSLKAWAVATHDSIVFDAIDRLVAYALRSGASEREAEREAILEELQRLANHPTPVLLMTQGEVADALRKYRTQEERDEFFGDAPPAGMSSEAGTWLSEREK